MRKTLRRRGGIMHQTRRIMRLLLALLLACSPALATDLHVSQTAAKPGDGSQDSPFATIAEASAKLKPGDRCIIHAGTYRETIRPATSGAAGQPIIYAAANGEKAIISGNDLIASLAG